MNVRGDGSVPAASGPAAPGQGPADSLAVVSPRPAIKGYGRPRWWQRLRSALGLGGMIVFCGILVAAAIAALLLAFAILVATAFS